MENRCVVLARCSRGIMFCFQVWRCSDAQEPSGNEKWLSFSITQKGNQLCITNWTTDTEECMMNSWQQTKRGLEVKQNRTWLKKEKEKKKQWLTEKHRQGCVSVCWSQQEQLQRDLNGGLEWWITGCWGLVTPPISTSKQVNKLQCTCSLASHFASVCH